MAEAATPDKLGILYYPPTAAQVERGEDYSLDELDERFARSGMLSLTRFTGPDGEVVHALTPRPIGETVDPDRVRAHALQVGAITTGHLFLEHYDTASEHIEAVWADSQRSSLRVRANVDPGIS